MNNPFIVRYIYGNDDTKGKILRGVGTAADYRPRAAF